MLFRVAVCPEGVGLQVARLIGALRTANSHAATHSCRPATHTHGSSALGSAFRSSSTATINSHPGSTRGAHSTRTEAEDAARPSADAHLELPGGRVPYTHQLRFVGGPDCPPASIPCYRTIDSAGRDIPDAHVPHPLSQELALRLYTSMARLQTMDTLFYEAQRQGRFSFYLTCQGEEATNIGSAAALDDRDMVFAQYREQGVLLWRGYTLEQFANQLLGTALDPGKGRQMPIHYGSPTHAYQTISSPLATQMPHAVGAAYAYKMDRLPLVSVTYFGDGASSEGDAHAALNFAAVLGAPALFVCRNNGYAISTPAHEQYRGDGIAGRGPMYGIPSIRVDGGDVRAVYNAVREARARALGGGGGGVGSGGAPAAGVAAAAAAVTWGDGGGGGGGGQAAAAAAPGPVLLECMSYRCGHHSTSDDSTRYRSAEEMRSWRSRDPVARFRAWLGRRGWWDDAAEAELRREAREEVLSALASASRQPRPPLSDLFTDVYAAMPPALAEQRAATLGFAARHPGLCPPGVPLR